MQQRWTSATGPGAVAAAIVTAGAIGFWSTRGESEPALQSLAVLPFANLTGDPELDRLAEQHEIFFVDDGSRDGTGELHPTSHIYIMMLLPDDLPESVEPELSDFVTALWDVGLEIGHSVRTVDQCLEQAVGDLTVATTLIEARLLDGPVELFESMQAAISPDRIWPSTEFFEEKRKEQIARHHRYGDTAYNLEPNVKGSPGGLRDIQMIGWVAKRHFGAETLHDLVTHDFLTEGEHLTLLEGQSLLWRIRFALHRLAGRREDDLGALCHTDVNPPERGIGSL